MASAYLKEHSELWKKAHQPMRLLSWLTSLFPFGESPPYTRNNSISITVIKQVGFTVSVPGDSLRRIQLKLANDPELAISISHTSRKNSVWPSSDFVIASRAIQLPKLITISDKPSIDFNQLHPFCENLIFNVINNLTSTGHKL